MTKIDDATSEEGSYPSAVLFDLDGVVVDTARFHYLAWKEISDQEGIYFDTQINERLKGVSRMECLDIILEKADRVYNSSEKEALASTKNSRYLTKLRHLTEKDILPGIPDLLDALREAGIRTAIVSASRNTNFILKQLGLKARFKVIVTGNDTSRSKPDPEGFSLAASRLGLEPAECVVIEDAAAGIEAATAACMRSIGIGNKTLLGHADRVLPSTEELNIDIIRLCPPLLIWR